MQRMSLAVLDFRVLAFMTKRTLQNSPALLVSKVHNLH